MLCLFEWWSPTHVVLCLFTYGGVLTHVVLCLFVYSGVSTHVVLCLFVRIVVSNTCCVVFVFVCLYSGV